MYTLIIFQLDDEDLGECFDFLAAELSPDPATVLAWVQASGRQVLTFTGYSGAGYEDEAAMLALAGQALACTVDAT